MSSHPVTASRSKQSGAVLLIVALGITVLLLFAGLALESGMLQLNTLRLQTATDAAAIAAARELARGNLQAMEAAARNDSALNGYPLSPSNRIALYHPPRSGHYAGDASAVEVVASHSGAALLMALSGHRTTRVSARAVGRLSANGHAILLGE
jgi:uncharacterized membrane protein